MNDMNESSILVSILYGLVGATGALSLVVLLWGFVVYIMRLGQVRRDEGIHIMQWGVGLIITAIILIGVLRLVQHWFSL